MYYLLDLLSLKKHHISGLVQTVWSMKSTTKPDASQAACIKRENGREQRLEGTRRLMANATDAIATTKIGFLKPFEVLPPPMM